MGDAMVPIIGSKWYTVHAHGKAAVMVVSLGNAEAPRVPRLRVLRIADVFWHQN